MISLHNLWKYSNTLTLRVVILTVVVAFIAYTELAERLDFVIYDTLLTSVHYAHESDIVIVEIDNKSLGILGAWPWSRSVHAELINRLKSVDNRNMAIDILFLEKQHDDPEADQMLASAITNHGQVVLPLAPVSTTLPGSLHIAAPYPLLRRNAVPGHVDIEIDSDGIVRRTFLYAGINAPTWPSLAMVLANPKTATKQYLLNGEDEKPVDPTRHWSRAEEILIPYIGGLNRFHKVSYADVMLDDDVLRTLKNKTAIVGMTAAGMGTRFATPLSATNRQPMTGVEWHAHVYSMLQNGHAIYPISNTGGMLISVIWIAIILGIMRLTKTNLTIPLLFLILITGSALLYYLLKIGHVWFPPSAALFGTLALYPLSNWQRLNQFIRSFLIAKISSNAALESVKDGVIITDAHNAVVYINKGTENILQSDFKHAQGKLLQDILQLSTNHDDPTDDARIKEILNPSTNNIETLECTLITMPGDTRIVKITRNQIHDEHKVLIGSAIAITDITDTAELVQQVARQENYDTLTKLPNRAKLLSQFGQMTQHIKNTTGGITVFFVALDNFKKINDAMGHQAGDKLLKMVSSRLNEALHHDDIAARWGGDEFILLFNHLNTVNSATEMAQKILDVIRQRFEIENMDIFVAASIGISFYPNNGLTSEVVLKRAETAMYRAKRDGGNSFDFYSSESAIVWTRDRLELEKELRAAIVNKELQVLFQPIINAETRHITRMEALIRWPHPTRGYLSPSDFIPLAENAGLIEPLGELVLNVSCMAAQQLLQLGYTVNVSVNVNPRQLLNQNFLQTVTRTLQETRLPAHALILEITESAIVSDIPRVGEILSKLKNLKINIALDDFGTGYSSLTLLRELPIDILKIDKSFVRTLDQNQNDLTIVQAIIGLGNNMGLTVVAEGVETAQQTQILLQHHCLYQQGYYFSRPIPYTELLELIHENNEMLSLQ